MHNLRAFLFLILFSDRDEQSDGKIGRSDGKAEQNDG